MRSWFVASFVLGFGGWLNASLLAQEVEPAKSDGKSPPAALNRFADAANFQNNGAFELAVEEWEKFLQQFPNDPLVPKARHYAGVCHLQLKHYEQAAEHFQKLAKEEKFELAADASINLAWCQFSLGGQGKPDLYRKAIQTLNGHLERFPQGKFLDQALFYLGESHYALGNRPEAISAYQRLVEQHPKSNLRADALYALGVTQEETKQHAAAGATYDSFLKEFPKSDLATEVRMRKGETLFHSGDIGKAEAIFAEVAAKPNFPAADHAVFRQADCAAKQDRFADAGQLYASVATKYPESSYRADATIAAARCFYRADQFEAATQWLRETMEQGGKDHAEAAHWLCRIHLKQDQADAAVKLAESAVRKAGDSPYVVNLKLDRADALYEIPDRKADSIEAYRLVAAEHPESELAPQALYNAAFAALELKRCDEATTLVGEFAQKFPEHRLLPDARYVAAECQLQSGELAQAEAAYRELLQQHSGHAEAGLWRVRQGLALYLQKKYASAAKTLAESLDTLTKPEQLAEAQFLIGVSKFEQNQPAEAREFLAKSLETQPKWRQADEALLFLSRAQKAEGQIAEAVKTVEQLIKQFPDSRLLDQAHYRLGEYRDASGDHAAATAAYDVVLTKFDSSPLAAYAHYGKGWSQMRAKDFAGATASFSELLQKHPDHSLVADASFARGMSRRQAGEHEAAIADIDAFLKTRPETQRQSDALYERGLAQAALKQYAAAAESFTAVLEAQPNYPHAPNVLYEMAWARKNGGDQPAATAAFARLAAEHATSPLAAEAWYHVGEDQYQKQQFAEALKAYQSAQPKAEGELAENVVHKIGWSHFRLGQYDPAWKAFRNQLQKFPSGPLAGDATFMQAESLFKQEKYPEAWPAFQAALEMPAAVPQMQQLTYLHGAQSAAQLGEWQESLKLLERLLEKFADSAYVPEALYERGWAKQNLKQPAEALADYELAATKSRNEVGARARFMIGELQFEQKDFAEAIKNFLRVMYGYGGENAPDAVKTWQGSAGFEAGRCAEVQISAATDPQQRAKWLQDAKTYYTFVAEKHPQHTLAAKAKERLAALAKVK